MNKSRDDEALAILSKMRGLSPDADLIQLEFLYVCGIPFVAWVLFEIRVQHLFEKEVLEQRFPDYQDGSWSSNFKLGLYGYLSLIRERHESWYPRSLFPSRSTKPVYACAAAAIVYNAQFINWRTNYCETDSPSHSAFTIYWLKSVKGHLGKYTSGKTQNTDPNFFLFLLVSISFILVPKVENLFQSGPD